MSQTTVAPDAGVRTIRRVKTPTVLQMEAAECGAAALGIILAYYGRYVPLEQLRVDCGVSRDGSKASNINKVARKYGLEAKGLRKELDEVKRLAPPFIIFWNFDHFLVVEGFVKNKVYLNDPAFGPRVVTLQEFDDSFTGVVLTFQRGPSFEQGGQPRGILRSLAPRLAGLQTGLAFIVLVGLALVIPGLVIPIFGKVFVDDILVAGRTNWLGPLLIGMGVTACLRAGLTALQQHYLLRLETRLAVSASAKFLWHVLRLPVEFFTQRYAGDISARVASNDRVAYVLSAELGGAIVNLAAIVFFAVVMVQYDLLLTAVGIAAALLNFAALRLVARRRIDFNMKMQQDQGKLLATAMGGLQTIESIKASGTESDFFERWAGYQAKVADAGQKLGVPTAFLDAVPLMMSQIAIVATLLVGGWRVMDGHLTMGDLVAFQSLMASFIGPVNGFVPLASFVQEVQGDMNRLDDVHHYQLDETFEVTASEALPPGSPLRLYGQVELRHITYGYNRLEKPLIQDFNLFVKPGRRVALVGGSGSGKSTLAKVITGLVQPWEGEILFDGKPRNTIPRQVLNYSLALVDQDISLFAGTVRGNLSLWDTTVPETRVVHAARDACIHDDVAGRTGGYESWVGEAGFNFSGGQRQRLEIARALVSNPTIVVLDEATSALDPVTEKNIDDHLRRRGCTCIIIAHRLSTIRDCDEIIVLDGGQVVQRGTHDELKAAEGPYAQLIRDE